MGTDNEDIKTENAAPEKSDLYIGTDSSYENSAVETGKPLYDDDEIEEYEKFGKAVNSVETDDSKDGFVESENPAYPPNVDQDTRVQANRTHGLVENKSEAEAKKAEAESAKKEETEGAPSLSAPSISK